MLTSNPKNYISEFNPSISSIHGLKKYLQCSPQGILQAILQIKENMLTLSVIFTRSSFTPKNPPKFP